MATAELEWLEGGITAVPGILAGGIVALHVAEAA